MDNYPQNQKLKATHRKDRFVAKQRRLLHETEAEAAALEKLGMAAALGAVTAMREAEEILDNAAPGTTAMEWRKRVYALAEARGCQNCTRIASCRNRGSRAAVNCPNWPFTCLPFASKRAVESNVLNCV